MESVGPVESGDSRALPDFSRLEQRADCQRLAPTRESSQSFPVCPQPVENLAELSTCLRANRLAVGSEFHAQLVGAFLPWFMPGILHSRISIDP